MGDSILQVGAVKIDFNRARYILLARLLALTMVNIGMEDSCFRNMHQFRRGSLEREVCRSSRGDLKGIRHLIWFTRLIIVILLLMCSVLVMLVYTLRYSVSNQVNLIKRSASVVCVCVNLRGFMLHSTFCF